MKFNFRAFLDLFSKEKQIARLIARCSPLTQETHPELFAQFMGLCEKHGVKKPPKLLYNEFLPMRGAAVVTHDVIIVGYNFFHEAERSEKMATIFHEFGHLLYGHNGPSRVAWEHAADSIAVQFTGEHQGMKKIVEHSREMSEAEEKMLKKAGKMGHVAAWLKKTKNESQYGTFAERIERITSAPREPTEEFRELIQKRNRIGERQQG